MFANTMSGLSVNFSYLLMLVAVAIALYSQVKVNSTFQRFLRVPSIRGYSGGQVARAMLDRNGLGSVPIEVVAGKLSDHYDPSKRVLRLSRDVYSSTSIAAVSVAAHEVGHAIQHQEGYAPLNFRTAMAPITQISSQFVWLLILAGLFLGQVRLFDIGVILFFIVVLFQLVTLPVEFNASRRAIANLEDGFIQREEVEDSKKVLGAAALTYVASTLVAVTQLLRLMSMRRRD
jgi:Zn-dependent membrane protease YugP